MARPRIRFLLGVTLLFSACAGSADPGGRRGALVDAIDDGGELRSGALDGADLKVSRAAATGLPDAVRAVGDAHLVLDDTAAPPAERALTFLADYGAVVGLDAADRLAPPLTVTKVVTDAAGGQHVRLAQAQDGVPAIGGELTVHLDARGVTAVTGSWVPDAQMATTPTLDAAAAGQLARRAVAKDHHRDPAALTAEPATLAIYRPGLAAGVARASRLAWGVTVAGDDVLHQVWIDAHGGAVLDGYSLRHDARHRIVYTPQYLPAQPALFKVREEGQAPTLIPMVDNLYDFSGHTYGLFADAFGRDSYDGAGAIMRTVYLVDQNCPNAYWNGATTNYCPAFDLDDVVAHEWGHAYTQHTHGLIYAYQSGALNESYSDIWGETVDLLNGVDGLGGGANEQPAPDGVRWAVGEDFGTGNGEYELLLRDMWDPERLDYPATTDSANYVCGTEDNGGVHSNSGVPNHAYAMLVDGKTFRGVTVTGIGFVKAAHIYYQAMTAYQTSTTTFEQHADALEMSCADLTGVTVAGFFGLPAATITAADCAQVALAMTAVGMREPPPCDFQPLLAPDAPAACPGGSAALGEDWSDGLAGWTAAGAGVMPEWPGYLWTATDALPAGRTGRAAFAIDSVAGTCTPGGDYSGRFWLDSPVQTAPASGRLELRFDHYVETELGYDGGNLMISIDGGAFAEVPASAFRHNAPRSRLAEPAPIGNNTNPKAGQLAWHGADEGGSTGSWGTTVVDLSQLVEPGRRYQLRFDFGIDGCNGVTGWYVGALSAASCPSLTPPSLVVVGAGTPDTDGSYTLAWGRPEGAVGPDELQQSSVCVPRLADDAEGGLARWTRTQSLLGTSGWDATSDKPQHASKAFRVQGIEGVGGWASLTSAAPVALPAGARITLRFADWFVNEPDDRGFVEVSLDGSAWTVVYTADRAAQAGDADAAFATEPLTARAVDLTAYAGRSVHLRFRYAQGTLNYFAYRPVGWWLDDIVVEASRWDTVLDADVVSTLIRNRASGDYCYRVRTTHTAGGVAVESDWSNVVQVRVARGDGAADGDGDSLIDAADNCPAAPNLDQRDTDGDGSGDVCDPCPTRANKRCHKAR